MMLIKEAISPIADLGYKIRIIKPKGRKQFLWQVIDYKKLVFSGSFDELLEFRQKCIGNVALIA